MILRKISILDFEWFEDPTHELDEPNDVAKLEAENIELRNAINGKNQILHLKENEIWDLKETIKNLRGNIKYYLEEIDRLDVFRASQDIRIPKRYQDGM